jgi:hypothetical protein
VNLIKLCLDVLVDFIYDRIAKKRRESIQVMFNAAKEGINNTSIFADRINNYFTSTYIPELSKLRIEYSIEVVWEYIRIIINSGDVIDRAKHLRGSCDRMLVDNPDNGAFHLLRAYATLLINPDSLEIIADAQKGISLFQAKDNLPYDSLSYLVDDYCKRLIQCDPQRGQDITSELILNMHSKWIEDFTNTYFDGVKSNE